MLVLSRTYNETNGKNVADLEFHMTPHEKVINFMIYGFLIRNDTSRFCGSTMMMMMAAVVMVAAAGAAELQFGSYKKHVSCFVLPDESVALTGDLLTMSAHEVL